MLQVGSGLLPGYETSSTESPATIDLTQCVVGVDLGDRKSVACVYRDGIVREWFEFAMTPEGVNTAFEGKNYKRVALEAGAQSGWVTRQLRTLGVEPVVANPRKLKAISANERKSDRNDALILAKLVWSDASLLCPIHHHSEETALALTILRARDTAVSMRTGAINPVRSMAKGMGKRLKTGSAQGFAMREAEVPAALAPSVTGLFLVLRALNEQIAAYDEQLDAMIEDTFPAALTVQQIRGVGPVTALAFVLTLEDPSRFPNGRIAAAFLGLVPRRDQSGNIDRQLGISKTGNNYLRRMLVQCAQHILGPLGRDCALGRWGHALMERGGKNAKKRTIVAAARKLAVLMYRLWKTGETWNPLHNSQPDAVVVVAGDRPEPAVSDDCEKVLEVTGDREPRGIDCSSAGSSDPSMHRDPSGPTAHLRALFLRLKGKRGPKKAIVAVAAEIMRSTWYMLTRNEEYREPNPAAPDPVRTEREARRLVGKLKKLGYAVELPLAAK